VARFWFLSLIVVGVAVVLALITPAGDTGADARYLGMKVVGWGDGDPCWLAMTGKGVLVLGAGVGVVEYGAFGVGILFACGQAAAGLIAFAQGAFGAVFVVAQLGVGLTGMGQLFVGGWGMGQGRVAADGKEFLRGLNEDLNDILRLRASRRKR
jgi:hypothetical protein